MKRLLVASVVMLLSIGACAATGGAMEQGRARSEAFLAGELDAIWDAMSPALRRELGRAQNLHTFREQLRAELGSERRVLAEEVRRVADDLTTYRRTARWSNRPGRVVMEWTFDPEREIAGFIVRPLPVLAESRFLDYRTKSDLQLPFGGTWLVFWGGRTLDENYHAANAAQRFAYDFLVRKDGSHFAGDDPGVLENYHCWGAPIVAPAAGEVVAMENERRDNPIGRMDRAHPLGNHVVLDLGRGEYAVLAHLQKGSVAVAPGDTVTRGERLGLCGNSGNSSEPHLHMHLQNSADPARGEGLPAQFQNYLADGEPVPRGEPVQGQSVGNAPS